jgi:putative membrane protein
MRRLDEARFPNAMKIPLHLLCTASLALGLLSVQAADTTPTAADTHFVKEAAIGGMAEVKAGQLATENGDSAAVKEFGALMVKDHGKANTELMNIATAQKIELPTALDEKHQMMVDHLGKLKGAEFDKAYVNDMVTGHEKTIALFKTEGAATKDPELKAFVEKVLPVIEGHLKKIEEIKASMAKAK